MTRQLDMRALIAQQDTEPDTYARYRVVPDPDASVLAPYGYHVMDAHTGGYIQEAWHENTYFRVGDAMRLASTLNEAHTFGLDTDWRWS